MPESGQRRIMGGKPRAFGAASAIKPPRRSASAPVRFGFVLLPGFTLLSLAGFIEVLRVFCDEATFRTNDRCRWTLLAADEHGLSSSGGLNVGPIMPLGDPSDYDYVVLVGGKRPSGEPTAKEVVAFLREADRRGIAIVSLSAATFDLARLGMLKDCSICVHWDQLREFTIEFAELTATSDTIFTVDGRRITCAGGTYVVDLALHILSSRFGEGALGMTLALMGIQQSRGPSHFQQHLATPGSAAHAARLSKMIRLLETRADKPPTCEELARHLHMSTRHLARMVRKAFGKSPQQLSLVVRLRRAQWLIQQTGKSVSQIAYECGFADSSHFARAFKREFNLTPSSIRHSARRKIGKQILTDALKRWEAH